MQAVCPLCPLPVILMAEGLLQAELYRLEHDERQLFTMLMRFARYALLVPNVAVSRCCAWDRLRGPG